MSDILIDIERTSECVYLCGNSLGLEPKVTKDIMNKELDKWSKKYY
jgi:kynureninase